MGCNPHRIHGTGIFSYILFIFMVNVSIRWCLNFVQPESVCLQPIPSSVFWCWIPTWYSCASEKNETGRWFQMFFMFIPKLGEDEPILTNIFQMGCFNHQPANMWSLIWGKKCWFMVENLLTNLFGKFGIPKTQMIHGNGIFTYKIKNIQINQPNMYSIGTSTIFP